MFRSLAVFALLGVSSVFALAPAVIPRGCASHLTAEQVEEAEADFAVNKVIASSAVSFTSEAAKKAAGEVGVYFHVITKDNTTAGGVVTWVELVQTWLTKSDQSRYSDEQITKQMDILNADFNSTGITFVLRNTTRTLNATWFSGVAPEEPLQTEMKETLRVGTKKSLNLYTVGFESGSGQGLLGYATFPSSYKKAQKDDGVVCLFSSLPGGSTKNYNRGLQSRVQWFLSCWLHISVGRTLTHEVGHWVGLYHTFQGGCKGKGDQVDDTPAEASPASGCPVKRDTCPGITGEDPVHNFME
jgi:hypothetical protein